MQLKIVQINSTVNSGSTGRIAELVGNELLAAGHRSYIIFGRGHGRSKSIAIKVTSRKDVALHGLKSRLLDRHGFGSTSSTNRVIDHIEKIRPDVVHLHNLHGYYVNIKILFDFLRATAIPTVWTLHDSWPYTGHCTFYESVSCLKWITECGRCPKKSYYPASYLVDQSGRNFKDKKRLYSDLGSLFIVTPSRWLDQEVGKSFLKDRLRFVIHNGIDVDTFQPRDSAPLVLSNVRKKIILGVASKWDKRKGLNDFNQLAQRLSSDFQIVLVGLSKNQIGQLPANVIGIERTENVYELSKYYSIASVFVNPTWQDNFPTTNLEALACGTPVITYDTGGSPESIDDRTGCVVPKGDISALCRRIELVTSKGKGYYSDACRDRAVSNFDSRDRYKDYLELYKTVLNYQ